MAENGFAKAASEDYSFDFGVRAISGDRATAAGYYGRVLGQSDAANIESVVREGLEEAHQRARASAARKEQARHRHTLLGGSLADSTLAPVPPVVDSVDAVYFEDPRSVPLDVVVEMAVDGCRALQDVGGKVAYCAASASTQLMRELFLSSDGADIDQTFAQTEGFAIVVCSGEHGNFELYDFTGHQRGWEILADGYDNGLIVLPDFIDFCDRLSADAREVADAPPLRPPDHDVVVVTNPHFKHPAGARGRRPPIRVGPRPQVRDRLCRPLLVPQRPERPPARPADCLPAGVGLVGPAAGRLWLLPLRP